MARNVRDLALMLDAMAGPDPRDPLSCDAPLESFSRAVQRPRRPQKIAFSADLGGITPIDPAVVHVCAEAVGRLSAEGTAVIENRCPDLSQACRVFEILRAELFVAGKAPLLDSHRELLKPEVVWNIERGLELTAADIGWAERERGCMQQRMAAFFEEHDLLLCPTTIVPPFPVEVRYLAELGEHRFCELYRLGHDMPRHLADGLSGIVPALRFHRRRVAGGSTADRAAAGRSAVAASGRHDRGSSRCCGKRSFRPAYRPAHRPAHRPCRSSSAAGMMVKEASMLRWTERA